LNQREREQETGRERRPTPSAVRRERGGDHTQFDDENATRHIDSRHSSLGDATPSETTPRRRVISRRKGVLITLDGMRVSERFVLDNPANVIGRDVAAEVKIADGEVSRRHAVILWSNHDDPDAPEPRCVLEDCGSTNGTFLNNHKIHHAKVLKDGDQVRVGRTVLGYFVKDERVLELDQMLLSMALRDALTGLAKREVFFSELHREFERAKRHSRPLSLALLDIDHFKRINDDHGHLIGDEALRRVSDLIRLSMREGDLSGRYGGEEFGVVFPETEMNGALLAVERIRQAIEQTPLKMADGSEINLTISCGLATLRDGDEDKLELLDAADQCLLEAKRTGRNRTVCRN